MDLIQSEITCCLIKSTLIISESKPYPYCSKSPALTFQAFKLIR